MNEERELAQKNQVASPIHETIDLTHASYDKNIANIVARFDKEKDALIVASHNVNSCTKAKELLLENDLKESEIYFGQLKGFSDPLSFKLVDEVSDLTTGIQDTEVLALWSHRVFDSLLDAASTREQAGSQRAHVP